MSKLKDRFTISKTSIPTRPGCWNVLQIDIWDQQDSIDGEGHYVPKLIGSYQRNYASFYNTFYPFEKNGNYYALYSKDYQTTSVMSLPDCEHIADTESYFCPVDFYVPDFHSVFYAKTYYEKEVKKAEETGNKKEFKYFSEWIQKTEDQLKFVGTRGLVSGCVWGDDSGGWKVMMLDLSNIEKGKIKLTNDLGHFQLPPLKYSLEELVQWEEPDRLTIPLSMEFQFSDDPTKSGFLGYSVEDLKMYSGEFYDHVEIKRVEKNKD